MKTKDTNSTPIGAGDKVRVVSSNTNDGVPDYRIGDVAKIESVTVDGIQVSYYSEPLSEYSIPVRAATHLEKL